MAVFLSSFYLSCSLTLSISICISAYIYLSLYISLSLSLSISPYLFLKGIIKKNGPPRSTPYMRRQGSHLDNRPYGTWIYCQYFWGGCMPHTLSWYQWEFFVCFLVSKEDAPMADVVSVGAIRAVDLLRLGPLDDTRDEKYTTFRVLLLIWDVSSNEAAFNKCACSRDALRKIRNQQITLIAADKQPCIKIFHAVVDVIRMLPETSLVNTPGGWAEWGGIYKYKFIVFS